LRSVLVLCLALAACSSTDPSPSASRTPIPTTIPTIDSGGPISLELVADGIAQPTSLAEAPDGSLLVTEQAGRIRVIRDGTLDPEPMLDLTDRVLNDGERGLLGMALHPAFEDNGRFFVMYSNRDTTDTELREFNVEDGQQADGTLLLEIRKDSVFHHGGSMQFGLDGYLYASIGDDGKQGNDRADPASLYGTVIRVDVDQSPGELAIPPDNPFADGGGRPEVLVYGLRNPWRIGIDAETGDLFIGDVGQNTAEEVNVRRAGASGAVDFGWSATEGLDCRDETCDTDGVTWPLVAYDHSGGECGVIGGYVLRGEQPLAGRYVYGDLCTGRIWSIDAADPEPAPRLEIESGLRLSSFGLGNDGTVYALVHFMNGAVYRVTG
jgi:glucose/arabinose dehydrogenase